MELNILKKLLSILFITSCILLSACQSTPIKPPATEVVQTKPKYEEFIQAGESLPLHSITDINGNLVDLTNPSKRKLVILFATWCSDSNRLLKVLNKSAILNDKSIEIIAIAREESTDVVKAWADKFDIKVPLAVDPDRSIYKQFAVGGIPRIVTVSEDNTMIKMNLAEGVEQLNLIEWE